MTHVITEPCVNIKDGACTDVCPVDCIYSREDYSQYFINPEECIDCGLCVDACPVGAIFPLEEVPPKWATYIERAQIYFGPDSPIKEALQDQSLTIDERRHLVESARIQREEEERKRNERWRQEEEKRRKDPRWIRHNEISKRMQELSPVRLREYWYLNEDLIESVFAQIQGKSAVEEKVQTQQGNRKIGGIKASLGNILSLLGMGGFAADISTEYSRGDTRETKYVLTTENKLGMVIAYFRATNHLGQPTPEISTEMEMKKAALLLEGPYELRDYSGNPLPTQKERREFIDSRSLSSATEINMGDLIKRGGCFVGYFGGHTVYVPFFFSGVQVRSRSFMWDFQRFALEATERKFKISIFGLRKQDSTDLVISPLAMWSEELRPDW